MTAKGANLCIQDVFARARATNVAPLIIQRLDTDNQPKVPDDRHASSSPPTSVLQRNSQDDRLALTRSSLSMLVLRSISGDSGDSACIVVPVRL